SERFDRAVDMIGVADEDDLAVARCDRSIGEYWRGALIGASPRCRSGTGNQLSCVTDDQIGLNHY
ncbi:MAG TPA: hypothetical protein VH497_20700, partial [Vicinamibacterales bacterium]